MVRGSRHSRDHREHGNPYHSGRGIRALVAWAGYRPGDILPCSPFVWWPGFLLGFLVNRKTQDRSACWAWTLAVGWLAYGIWDECRIYRFPSWHPPKGDFVHRAWHMFFSGDSKEWGGGGLLLFIFTMPALNAIAYSVGAWLALWLKRSGPREPSQRGCELTHEMALTRRIGSQRGHPAAARNLCRAQGTDREIRSGGDAGGSCPGRRGAEATTFGR